jgi:hypothetical protein
MKLNVFKEKIERIFMLERTKLKIEEKFLGRFPIKGLRGHETHRVLRLSNESGTNEIDLSLIHMEGQIDIHTCWTCEKVNGLFVPQLVLIRDLYNETLAALKMGALFDLTQTRKVMPPKFDISMEQQGNLITAKTTPDDLRENYHRLVQDICTKYGIRINEAQCEKDYVHQRRMILPVMKGYSIQITVPDGLTQTFEVHADNSVDYTHLDEISRELGPMLKRNLNDKIKVYDDRITTCIFNIHLDTSAPKRLDGKILERLVLN